MLFWNSQGYFLTLFLVLVTSGNSVAQLPEDFTDETVLDALDEVIGIEFVDSSLWYVWDRKGLLWGIKDERLIDEPILDINEEVAHFGDHGLIDIAIDPHFKDNGYIYLAYIVDPHHLRYAGTPDYSRSRLGRRNATIGRVTRYTMDTESFTSIDLDSRKILLGVDKTNGIPVFAPAHGIGGLEFGTDGTLLVGTGDGNSWIGAYTGGKDYPRNGFDSIGIVEGFVSESHNLGSYRAQSLSSLGGKILRIDAETGGGIESNPFYDSSDPNAAKSKIWSLGIRNPYRMVVRPGSGSENPTDGKPGVIYFGDVGSYFYEELNIVQGPAMNFGWPSYEGIFENKDYYPQQTLNPDAINPLAAIAGCNEEQLAFNDLLKQPNRQHTNTWTNPCDTTKQLSEDLSLFTHEAPVITWGNESKHKEETFFPAYDAGGEITQVSSIEPTSPIRVNPFHGNSSITGDFVRGSNFPTEYQDVYFHGDYFGWLKGFRYDTHGLDEIHDIISFSDSIGPLVHLRFNPFDGKLYYFMLDYSQSPVTNQLRRISFGGNPKPVANIEVDKLFGTPPFSVHISGASSFDPQGEPISYQWQIDQQPFSNKMDTTIFIELENPGPVNKELTLVVTDAEGQTDTARVNISLNNTPPDVQILNISDGDKYSLSNDLLLYRLSSQVEDAEHKLEDLSYTWEVTLDHNDHSHLEFTDTSRNSVVSLYAIPSSESERHAYTIKLTVTDPLGLSGTDAVTIHPDPALEADVDEGYHIFPNPTTEEINIFSARAGTGQIQIALINPSGQIVFQRPHPPFSEVPLKQISLYNLKTGIYYLIITDENGEASSHIILKE